MRSFSVSSPVGNWSVETNDTHLLSIDWIGDERLPREAETKLEKQIECMLSRYFKGEAVDFHRLPIWFPPAPSSSKGLNERVMRAVAEIPRGQIQTYQWLAERLGTKSFRAIGNAMGRNTIPIIVPCHRIVASDGTIGGFMRSHPSGTGIKRFLLELEGHRFETDRKGNLVFTEQQPLSV